MDTQWSWRAENKKHIYIVKEINITMALLDQSMFIDLS